MIVEHVDFWAVPVTDMERSKRFYGETLGGSDAIAAGPATRHDFMERFLHAHEGALTEMEGRIAGGWQLALAGI